MSPKDLLNPAQQAAAFHVDGPLLVLAGAGSGKTRIVTFRIAHLIELGVPSNEILAVTFTNKAAEEMRHRIQKLANASILTCTFHSLCAKILRESISAMGYSSSFHIFDEDDSEKVVKQCLAELNQKEEKALVKTIRSAISQAKNSLIEPDKIEATDDSCFPEAYALYQAKLKEYNALDFDDLLFLTVKLFKQFPDILEKYQKKWSFILIDEYQDTNAAQYMIARLLAAKHHNIFAVGDPDQSIYSWRGADIHNILNFEKDFPGAKVVALEQNYRSKKNILEAANALIRHNKSRYEKDLWSDLGVGEKIGLYICDSEHEEANFVLQLLCKHHEEEGIPLSECVIFYRTNFQSRVFEDALLRERIPYQIIGGLSFYQRREIKDLLAVLRMVISGSDFLSFSRTINLPKRGIGESTLAKLRAFAADHSWDIFTACTEIVERRVPSPLSQKQFAGLKEYVDAISALREMAHASLPLQDILTSAIERLRYLDFLKEDPESYEERRENIDELVSKAAEWQEETDYPNLTAFLEELSLKSSLDEKAPLSDSLRLMTLHNGKGLEFKVVFLVGMEEELFPHANARESESALEEERRLCYVGMTRAKEFLYLSSSRYRFLWGTHRTMRPSRFLKEIPREYLQSRSSYYSQREEPFASEEEEGFSPGDAVVHKDFGMGVIRKVYQTSLGLTYDVYFPEADATRTLVAKYAKLIPSKQERMFPLSNG